MRWLVAPAALAGCVGGTPKDSDSGVGPDSVAGHWVGSCTGVILGGGGGGGTTDTDTAYPAPPGGSGSTGTSTVGWTGGSYGTGYYWSTRYDYEYYTETYTTSSTVTLDPAVLDLEDHAGDLEGLFSFDVTYGLSYTSTDLPDWQVEGVRTGTRVALTVTGAGYPSGSTVTLDTPVTFELDVTGDRMEGDLVIQTYLSYDVASTTGTTTTATSTPYGYWYYSGGGYGGYPAELRLPCVFDRQ